MRHSTAPITALDALRRTCRWLMLTSALVGATSASLSAQPLATPGVHTHYASMDSTGEPDPRFLARMVPAALGGVVGAAAMGFAAYALAGRCSGNADYCGYRTLGVVIPGMLFGGILGSAAGAAAPRGRGLCTGVQRFGMGVGGAFLGTLAGFGLGMFAGLPPGILVTVPMGSVMFMRRC